MSKPKSGMCTICENHFQLLNWHHTVPQSLGGKDSLQIPLCAQCHDQLHAQADAIVASMKGSKAAPRQFWRNPREENNAAPFLEILVNAIASAALSGVDNKNWKMMANIPDKLHKALKMLKDDTPGLRNLEQALLLCLGKALKDMGYYETDKEITSGSKNKPKGTKPNLW
jgi:hypothetical protein